MHSFGRAVGHHRFVADGPQAFLGDDRDQRFVLDQQGFKADADQG